MNTMQFSSMAMPRTFRDSTHGPARCQFRQAACNLFRFATLAALYPVALADAAWQRLIGPPNGVARVHARAEWLHRWSRVVRSVLGVRVRQSGVGPASGIVVANYTSLLDAILLAAVRPCVFVACAEARTWPMIGLLARIGGTLFVDPRRRNDAARLNFMIQRAVRRRLLVVVFPECLDAGSGGALRRFSSALFQPAVELGCSLTGAAVSYPTEEDDCSTGLDSARSKGDFFLTRRWERAVISFTAPTFRGGNRKQLARRLHTEVLDLKLQGTRAAS